MTTPNCFIIGVDPLARDLIGPAEAAMLAARRELVCDHIVTERAHGVTRYMHRNPDDGRFWWLRYPDGAVRFTKQRAEHHANELQDNPNNQCPVIANYGIHKVPK